MIDIKQTNAADIKPDPTEMLLAEVEVRDADPKIPDREKTAGEVAVDWGIYKGVGFGVNELSSLWITDQFMYGKNIMGKWFSKQGFDEISAGIAKTLKIKESIDPAGKLISPTAKAGNMLLMVTLLSGGTLLLWPMKKFDDNKNYWVKKANHFIDCIRGSKMSSEQVEERDAEVEKAIACEPKQTWASLLLGRVIACSASVATGTFLVGPKNNDSLMNWSERKLTGSLQAEGQRNAAHRYARLLSVETYSCAISSFVLEVASKLFAKRGLTVHDPKLCTAVVHDIPVSKEPDNKTDGDMQQAASCKPCMLNALKAKPIAKRHSHIDAVENEQKFALAP